MKRVLVIAVIVLAVAFVAIQFVPVDRTNPPVTSPLVAPEPVKSILQRACNDCHSNETRWPWYAYVAPVSWLVADDVKDGRRHLNLSAWGEMSDAKRLSKADNMAEEVEAGRMPLPKYVLIHRDAKLSHEDVVALRKWADGLE
jgi:hypothetical protein